MQPPTVPSPASDLQLAWIFFFLPIPKQCFLSIFLKKTCFFSVTKNTFSVQQNKTSLLVFNLVLTRSSSTAITEIIYSSKWFKSRTVLSRIGKHTQPKLYKNMFITARLCVWGKVPLVQKFLYRVSKTCLWVFVIQLVWPP